METTVLKKLVPALSLGLMFLAGPVVFAQGSTSTMSHHHSTHHSSHHHSKSHHHKKAKKSS